MTTQHNFFETKVNYTGVDEATGKQVKLSDSYLIDALSFSEGKEIIMSRDKVIEIINENKWF